MSALAWMIRESDKERSEGEGEGGSAVVTPSKLRPSRRSRWSRDSPQISRAAAALAAAAAASLGSLLLLLQPCRKVEGSEWEGSTTPRPRPLLVLSRRGRRRR